MIIILYSDNGNDIIYEDSKYISLEAITQSDIYWMLRVKNVRAMKLKI